MQGSDHCPVFATLLLPTIQQQQPQPPALSSRYLFFAGKQRKLDAYFGKSSSAQPAAVAEQADALVAQSQQIPSQVPPQSSSAFLDECSNSGFVSIPGTSTQASTGAGSAGGVGSPGKSQVKGVGQGGGGGAGSSSSSQKSGKGGKGKGKDDKQSAQRTLLSFVKPQPTSDGAKQQQRQQQQQQQQQPQEQQSIQEGSMPQQEDQQGRPASQQQHQQQQQQQKPSNQAAAQSWSAIMNRMQVHIPCLCLH